MAKYAVQPTGREISFSADELIVSKTDLKGRITYCNSVFMRVANYTEEELLGAPHSLIRHPFMPRCVFKLLWDTLERDNEIFAYVLNMTKTGDAYWVLAHVTPSYDPRGTRVGYHSNRRVPKPEAVAAVKPVYQALLDIEAKHKNAKEGMEASFAAVVALLGEKGMGYDEFVLSL